MRKILFPLAIALTASLTATAAPQFISFTRQGDTALCLTHSADTVTYAPGEWDGVKMAVDNLRADLKAVTGSSNAPVLVATVGKSELAKLYPTQAASIKGKWEQYLIFPDNGRLVILGSDKRGTIYGIYELSRQIGVSPWYWMADAPIQKHDELFVSGGTYTDGEPKVRYRGIFINDEWPSFGGWCTEHFGGINSKAYSHLFELLLRLKANYFWPAMWGSRFNEDDPLSPELADRMGIVMGTSHHEPMMRAHQEYVTRREQVGPWDYSTNAKRLDKFFEEGIRNAKDRENIVTIGMRGDGDVAMGTGNDADNIKTLGKVVKSQRRIISKVTGRKASETPQLWAIFTEVQRYYDAGFTVPDDVTLLFCDNNWGYIRRIGTETERKRSGGLGLYYHIDMNGGPWNDRWVTTTTIPKLREQLGLAYRSGIDRIWIINVGDLKPKEVPIDFIMNYAWNPDAVQPGDEQAYLENFAASIFGEKYAAEVADIIAKYTKYNLWRKAEVQYPGIFNEEEMLRTGALWQSLVTRCENLRAELPEEMQDAFYQLVYYPAVGSAGVAQIYNYATLGDSLSIEALMLKDKRLTDYYNEGIAGGKWRGMMQDKHIGYTRWYMADKDYNPLALGLKAENDITVKPTDEYSIPAWDYKSKSAGAQAEWIFLPDLGRGRGCMGSSNVTAPSELSGGAALEYEIELTGSKVAIGILPTQDIYPARGLRLGVQVDDLPMQTIDARQGLHDEFGEYTESNLAVSKVLKPLPEYEKLLLSGWQDGKRLPRHDEVFDNMRWLSVDLGVAPGKHTLRIVMIDPEIVVEQIVVNPDNSRYSYFGAGYWDRCCSR